MLWKLLTKIVNKILSSLIRWESHRVYKRTQQEVFNILLSYLYYKYMVYASNK